MAGSAVDMQEVLAKAVAGDFDPAEYDAAMAAAFGDEYYEVRPQCSSPQALLCSQMASPDAQVEGPGICVVNMAVGRPGRTSWRVSCCRRAAVPRACSCCLCMLQHAKVLSLGMLRKACYG